MVASQLVLIILVYSHDICHLNTCRCSQFLHETLTPLFSDQYNCSSITQASFCNSNWLVLMTLVWSQICVISILAQDIDSLTHHEYQVFKHHPNIPRLELSDWYT